MPNRIIRESALTSHSLARLSDGAERLFWRLTLIADDAGRFDAFGATVKARCFPVVVDDLSTLKVGKWLAELSQDHVQFYEVDGRQYGQFRKWSEYQRSYGLKSKFPEPPADCGNVRETPALIRETISERRESKDEIRDTLTLGFERFWRVYPRKASKDRARRAWEKLKPDEPLQDRILDAIERAKTSVDWTKDSGQWIPYPATWLNDKRWLDEPVQVVSPQQAGIQAFLQRGQS